MDRIRFLSIVAAIVLGSTLAAHTVWSGVSDEDERALLESNPEGWALQTFKLGTNATPEQIYTAIMAFVPRTPMLCPPPQVDSELMRASDEELIGRYEALTWESAPKRKLDLLQVLDSRGDTDYQLHDFDLIERYFQAGRVGCANWRAFLAEPVDSFCGNYYQSFYERKAVWQYRTLIAAGELRAAVGLLVAERRYFQVRFVAGYHSEHDYPEELTGFGLDPAVLAVGEFRVNRERWEDTAEEFVIFLMYLRAVGTAETLEIIEQLSIHPEPRVRAAAVEALGVIAFNPPDGETVFFGSWSNFYGGYDVWVRELDEPERRHIHELILAMLLDPDVEVAKEAVAALGNTRERRFYPVLLALVMDHRTRISTYGVEDEQGNVVLEDKLERPVADEAQRILGEW